MAPVTIMRAVICDAAATRPSATPTLIHIFDGDGGSAACESSRGRALALITSNLPRGYADPPARRACPRPHTQVMVTAGGTEVLESHGPTMARVGVHVDCRIGGESESLAGGQIDALVTELGGSVVRGGLGLRLAHRPPSRRRTSCSRTATDPSSTPRETRAVAIVKPSWIHASVDASKFLDAAAFAG